MTSANRLDLLRAEAAQGRPKVTTADRATVRLAAAGRL
jgi:hypothetical protein